MRSNKNMIRKTNHIQRKNNYTQKKNNGHKEMELRELNDRMMKLESTYMCNTMQTLQTLQAMQAMHTLRLDEHVKKIKDFQTCDSANDTYIGKYVPPCYRKKNDSDKNMKKSSEITIAPVKRGCCVKESVRKDKHMFPFMIIDAIVGRMEKNSSTKPFDDIKIPDNNKEIRKNISDLVYPDCFEEISLRDINDIISKGNEFINIVKDCTNKLNIATHERDIDRDIDRNIDRDIDRNINRNVDRDIDRDIDREIDREIDRDIDRDIDMDTEWNNVNNMTIRKTIVNNPKESDWTGFIGKPLISNKHYDDNALISDYKIEKDKHGLYILNGKKYSINIRKIMKLVRPLELLRSMIGMTEVKENIYRFIAHFLQNEETSSMVNTAIYGKPGVGKTDLGKILCMIYSALEIVPSSRFRLIKASELIGRYVGETRQKTKEILDEANGGILFIDEAYSLMSGSGDRYSYGKECIDTLNQELSENRRNLVIIIAGYENEIENTFFKANDGLDRRFPFRYTLKDYTSEEMKDIMLRMIRLNNVQLSSDIMDSDILELFSDTTYFGNCGGDIENLLTNCKFASNVRSLGKHPELINVMTKEDLKNGLISFKKHKNIENSSYQSMYT